MHMHNYSEHITITDSRIVMHSYKELKQLLVLITDLCLFGSPIGLILVLIATLCLFKSPVGVTELITNQNDIHLCTLFHHSSY